MRLHKISFSLRTILAGLAVVAMLFSALPALAATAENTDKAAAKKPLVVYFSESGHTKKVAEMIHQKVGGDILRVEPEKAYPQDYDTLVKLAKKEQAENARPAIKTAIPNLEEYGVIFLGYPNWWSSLPMPMFTFIEQAKMDGRVIAPFDTHGGGGLGHSIDDLKKALPAAKILKPLAVSGNRADSAEPNVAKWLEELGPALGTSVPGSAGPAGGAD